MAPGKRPRDPRFRDLILRAYEFRCAVCGFDGRRQQQDLFAPRWTGTRPAGRFVIERRRVGEAGISAHNHETIHLGIFSVSLAGGLAPTVPVARCVVKPHAMPRLVA